MKKRFGVITVLLVLIITFCTTGTVMGMEKGNVRVDEKYHRQMEQEYVRQVRTYLSDAGYDNSGVALTKVLYEDGSREYTLNIHHKRIEKLNYEEQEQLKKDLVGFTDVAGQSDMSMKDVLVVFS